MAVTSLRGCDIACSSSLNGRSLSLIPESASSAQEQVRFTVIGEDAWKFAKALSEQASIKFPSLCGGDSRDSNAHAFMTPQRSSSGRGQEIAASPRNSIHSRNSQMTPQRSGSAGVYPSAESAPFSCKFWLDGMKELDPPGEPQETDSKTELPEQNRKDDHPDDASAPDSDASVIIMSANSSPDSSPRMKRTPDSSPRMKRTAIVNEEEASPWNIVPSGPSQTSTCSPQGRKSQKDRKSIATTISDRRSIMSAARKSVSAVADKVKQKSGRSRTIESFEEKRKNGRSRSIVSVASVTSRKLSRALTWKSNKEEDEDEGDSEAAQRKVVCARYYPVEAFSEEVPVCRTLKDFKETVMLFLIDDRHPETSCKEKLSNLRFRKSEVERWIKFAMDKHNVSGAPAMLCVVLMHRSQTDDVTPFNSNAGERSSEDNCCEAQWCGKDESIKACENDHGCREGVDMPGKIVDDGLLTKFVSRFTNTSSVTSKNNGSSRSSRAKKVQVAEPTTAGELSTVFAKELRKSIDSDYPLQYDCNFNDAEALLGFIVRLSNVIIERRKDDPNCCTAGLLERLRAQNEKKEKSWRARCLKPAAHIVQMCSCVIA